MLDLCVLLNGPPGCGKDTLADMLATHGFSKYSFKSTLYSETMEYFGCHQREFMRRATDRSLKEKPWLELQLEGRKISPRAALIHVSEKVMKPLHGPEHYGQAAADRCVTDKVSMAVFSDSGFVDEMLPLCRAFKSVVVFRLRREGFSFEGDSRGYLIGVPARSFDILLVEGQPLLAMLSILDILSPTMAMAALNR